MASLPSPSQYEVDKVIRIVRGSSLINRSLQTICNVNGLKTTGVKMEMQNRIIDYIKASRNDPRQFHFLQQSVTDAQKNRYGHNTPYPPLSQRSAYPPAHTTTGMPGHALNQNGLVQSQSQYASASHAIQPGDTNDHQMGKGPNSHFTFKPSPFYTIQERIGPVQVLDEMLQHRHTVDILLQASDGKLVTKCLHDDTLRVKLLCAASNTGIQDVAFPQHSELQIAGEPVKGNMRGLKNKPGSTLPVDITDHLRLSPPSWENRLTFTYAITTQACLYKHKSKHEKSIHKFYLMLCVCKVRSADDLVKELETKGKKLPKHATIAELKKKAADPDIVATSQKISLKCPVAYTRLKVPCRSVNCKHTQCFDAATYLQLQQQGPQWKCPICQNSAPYDTLAVDMYVKDILNSTDDDTDKVTIEPDGQWHLGEGAQNSQSFALRSNNRDNDVIDILDEPLITGFTPARSLGTPSFAGSREASTPTAASGGKKRPLIDLTLDSDDDEPLHTAKRPNHGNYYGYGGGYESYGNY